MPGRLVSLGVGLASLVAIVAACYEVPRPDCGFVCGPDGACPDGYTCAGDGHCHRNGTSPSLMCTMPDGPLPVDAAPDVAVNAGDDAGSATAASR